MFSIGSFAEYLINEVARVLSKSGRKNLGKKLFVHMKSKKSPIFSRSEICSRFMLISSTIAAYVFSPWSISIMGESSDINCCIFTLSLLSSS